MRIVLFTLEGLAASRAVRRFVATHAEAIALVVLSDPFRREAGGALGQTRRRLAVSGPGILPYLFVNFSLPRLVGLLRRPAAADVDATPIAATCRRLGIPVETSGDVNAPALRARLAASGAALLVSFHFDQILKAETIASVPGGGINVHAGRLPVHRGPVPTIHALLDAPVDLGVTIHRLVPKIDAGALLAQTTIPDRPDLTALGAALALHEAALPLLDETLAALAAGRAVERPVETLPYRGFPTPDELRRLAAAGRRTVGAGDLLEAWRTPM